MVGFLGLMVCAFASTFGLKGTAYHWEVATSISAGDVMVLAVDNGTVAKELSGISGTATPYGTCADYTGTPAGTFALEVEAGSESGTFSFKSSGGYLSWSEGNSLTVSATKDKNSSWTVTFPEGVPTITNASDITRTLKYNSSNPRFACYTSAQTAVTLWKKVAGDAPVATGEYYVVGPEDFFGVAWAIDAENKMTASAGASGVFTKTYQGVEITASEAAPYTLLYKFLSADGRWFPAGTNNDMNYVIKQSGIYDITFKLDVNNFSDSNPYEPQNITVTLKEAVVGNIAALNKLSKDVEFTLTGDVLVVAKPTAKYVFIKDDTGSSLIYDNSGASTEEMSVGKTIAGGWQGKVSIYNGLFEAVPVEAPVMSDAPVVTVTYPEVAPEYVSDQHINEVVTLKGVHYSKPDGKNFNITVDGVDIVVPGYNQFGRQIAEPDETKTYDMVGAIGIYSKNNQTTIQFQPIEITEAVAEPIVWPAGLEGEDWKITTTAKPIVGDDVEVKDEACKVGFVTDDNVVYIQAELTALGQTVTATMKGIRDGDNNVILPKGQIVAQGTYMGQSISGYLFGPNASDAVLTYTETAEKTSLTNAGPIYLNVSPDGAGTNLFTLTNTEIYKAAETPTTMDYYVAGSMTEWKPVAANKMTLNTEATGEEYMLTLELKANDEFKVGKSAGETIDDENWYPQSLGNYTITQDGKYTIYFRPNADGGQDWYGGCIFVAMEEEPVGPVVWPAGLEGETWKINTTAQKGNSTPETIEGQDCKVGIIASDAVAYLQLNLTIQNVPVTVTVKGTIGNNNTTVTIPNGQMVAQETVSGQVLSAYLFGANGTDVVMTYSKTAEKESLTYAGTIALSLTADGTQPVYTLTNTEVYKELDTPTLEKFYIIGDQDGWSNTEEKPNLKEMTWNAETGAFEYSVTVEKDFYFAFGDVATSDSWDDFNANHRYAVTDGTSVEAVEGQTLQLKKTTGDASVKITTTGIYTVSVTKDLVLSIKKTGEVTPVTDHTYIVAGNFASIFGTSWDASNTDNKMEKQTDGTYQKTYTVDQAYDDVQLKVVEDGEKWHGDASGANLTFNLTDAGTFTVTFDPTTKVVTVTGEIVEFPKFEYSFVTAVGDGTSGSVWMNGVTWDPGAAANKMTKVSDDVWEIMFENVPATDNLQVKFVLDGDINWTYNFGGTFAAFGQETAAVMNGDNITFSTTEATNITLKLDLTGFNFATKEGAKFTITLGTEPPVEEATYLVAGSSVALFGTAWTTETDANNLTADATTGLYSKSWSKVALEAGDIEYKIVKKTATATTWIPDGDNQKYTIDEAGDYDVVVTFNPTTKEAVMTATKIYTPTLEGEAIYWTDGDVATAGNTAATYGTSTFQLSITDTNGKVAIDANTAYFGDATSQVMFTHRLKTGGASSSKNAMKLTIGSAGKLRLYVRTGSNSATDRNLVLTQNGVELYNQVVKEADAIEVAESDLNLRAPALDEPVMKKVYPIIEVEVAAGEVEITYPTNSLNFYCMQLIAGTTGISNIEVEQPMFDETKPAYNLKGERVTKSYRGMIIQNGRKFMNK